MWALRKQAADGRGVLLRRFQQEGVVFAVSHGGRALIADDMGLGKTVQVPRCPPAAAATDRVPASQTCNETRFCLLQGDTQGFSRRLAIPGTCHGDSSIALTMCQARLVHILDENECEGGGMRAGDLHGGLLRRGLAAAGGCARAACC